ncbi:hypothetical protein SKAU_G00092030 [Synaphobranchus kaupii]|uniref:Uncharacterized protein n=1 Tax=Synaphobranchus kaupii TaxID=118154 RepID=A0A9Q1FXR0_SYNKA|nr:hypothetical protein SKAU_G00092030 [Synaphobranchus kaupii]
MKRVTNVKTCGNAGLKAQGCGIGPQQRGAPGRPMMVCELFLLTSVWFLFVIFWMETISVWLFLCNFYQDRAFYHWGDGVFADDPGHMLYMLGRVDESGRMHT